MLQNPRHRFLQQCDPATALDSNDTRYVPGHDARGDEDLATRMVDAIRLANAGTERSILFTGHRGSGKSTELLRLKHTLENPSGNGEKFFVVYFQGDNEGIDINQAEFHDLLLAIIRRVYQALPEDVQEALRPGKLSEIWDFLKHRVRLTKVDLGVKYIVNFAATLEIDANHRVRIRELLGRNTPSLIEVVNGLLEKAIVRLRNKGYSDLVIIVDNLDRIVLRDLDKGMDTHERFFIDEGAYLTSLSCVVVYTLPINMAVTPRVTTVEELFGRSAHVLPMVRVLQEDGKDDEDGMAMMRQVVRRRIQAADLIEETVFDSLDTEDYLCRMSGGHLRDLVMLLRSAGELVKELPVTRVAAQRAVREKSNDFKRALNRPELFDALRRVDEEHDLPGSERDQLLLYNLSVLRYQNNDGRVWHAVHPAVRLMEKFNRASHLQSGPANAVQMEKFNLSSQLRSRPANSAQIQETLSRLARVLEWADRFTLIFLSLHDIIQQEAIREELLARLRDKYLLEVRVSEPNASLLANLSHQWDSDNPPDALLVYGLETSTARHREASLILGKMNTERDAIRRAFPVPLLLWLPDSAVDIVARGAPDFWAYRSGVYEFAQSAPS